LRPCNGGNKNELDKHHCTTPILCDSESSAPILNGYDYSSTPILAMGAHHPSFSVAMSALAPFSLAMRA